MLHLHDPCPQCPQFTALWRPQSYVKAKVPMPVQGFYTQTFSSWPVTRFWRVVFWDALLCSLETFQSSISPPSSVLKSKQETSRSMLESPTSAGFFLGFLFHPQYGCSVLLRSVRLSPDYTALQARKMYSSWSPLSYPQILHRLWFVGGRDQISKIPQADYRYHCESKKTVLQTKDTIQLSSLILCVHEIPFLWHQVFNCTQHRYPPPPNFTT
jgi:hypothetical protein